MIRHQTITENPKRHSLDGQGKDALKRLEIAVILE